MRLRIDATATLKIPLAANVSRTSYAFPKDIAGGSDDQLVQLLGVGKETCLANYCVMSVPLKCFVVEFIVAGRGQFIAADNIYDIVAGELLCYQLDQRHQISSNRQFPLVKYYAAFRPSTQWLDSIGLQAVSSKLKLSSNPTLIHGLFKEAMHQLRYGDSGRRIAIRCLELILLNLYQPNSRIPISHHQTDIARFNAIELLIQDSLLELRSVDDLAAATGMTRRQLVRLFRQFADESPLRYLLRCRLTFALRLMKEDNLSIADSASAVGFTDANYFSRLFKKYFGSSPSQLRQMAVKPSVVGPAVPCESVEVGRL